MPPLVAHTSIAEQMAALDTLRHLNRPDAVGAACSYLLLVAQLDPEMLRKVLNEKVVREGFRGVSLLETFNRLCR